MKNKDRLFREAIETFKVIDTCLRCFYAGETHMYRPLSAQLRILLCDTDRGKDNALLTRLFKELTLTPLHEIISQDPGTFGEPRNWANSLIVATDTTELKPKLAVMPFEITQFKNDLEICDIVFNKNKEPIPIEDWLKQTVSIYPTPVTVKDLIKTVADRGGGAHVHHQSDALLVSLADFSPCKTSIDALLTIAFARIAQEIGWYVVQFYEKIGTEGNTDELAKVFDKNHKSIVNSAKVESILYKQEIVKFNLMSIEVV